VKGSKGNILVVEDDKNQRGIIRTILMKEGFYVEDVGTGRAAADLLMRGPFDLVLTDLKLPDVEGTEVLKEVRAQNRPCHVIIITAYGSIPSAIEATKMGAFYYLEKPFEKDQLLLVVQNALDQVRLLKDNIMLKDQVQGKYQLENIVGSHGRMEELFRTVAKVAPTNSTVLICGESGTGKELFARSIHYASPRNNKPFFAINCAAIPETLLESELFGYEKGAFTGAITRHIGLFEQANGSSLFLDEIGDLSLNTQAKILRAIQEREIRRLGGKEPVRLDVRIIAASNKKLEEEIACGRFRQDLYYRLNVIAFTIPPLRERSTDIPLLVKHFLKNLNRGSGKKKAVSQQALQYLAGYPWPGNVRQLESVIERAYIMCDGEVIGLDHLPEEIRNQTGPSSMLHALKPIADYLIDTRLTAAEYRLYLYFLKLGSPEACGEDLIEPKAIMERLGISKETFYTGIARLRELGLYDFRSRAGRLKTKPDTRPESEFSD
jgi:two-component system response regulator PilR (NtrC family)